MNRDKDKENPDIIDDVPPRLRKAGLTKITTNLAEGQSLRLPKGLVVTFFKHELMNALSRHAIETQAKQKETEIKLADTTNLEEEKP